MHACECWQAQRAPNGPIIIVPATLNNYPKTLTTLRIGCVCAEGFGSAVLEADKAAERATVPIKRPWNPAGFGCK